MPARKILAIIYNSLEIDSDLYQAQFIAAFFKLDFMNYRDANMQKFWDDYHAITHAAGNLATEIQKLKFLFKHLQKSKAMTFTMQPFVDAESEDRTLDGLMKIWKRHVDRLEQANILAADEKETLRRQEDRLRDLGVTVKKPDEEKKGNANPSRRQANAYVAPDGNVDKGTPDRDRGKGQGRDQTPGGGAPAKGTAEFKKIHFCIWNVSKYNCRITCSKTAQDCDYGHWQPKTKENFDASVAEKPWFLSRMKDHVDAKKAGGFTPKAKAKGAAKDKEKRGRSPSNDKDKNKDKNKDKGKGTNSRNSSPSGRDKGPRNPDFRPSGAKTLAHFRNDTFCHECTADNVCKIGDEDCKSDACRGKRCHFPKDVATELLSKAATSRKAGGAVVKSDDEGSVASKSGSGSGGDVAPETPKKKNRNRKKKGD